jgi:hypothetical protein
MAIDLNKLREKYKQIADKENNTENKLSDSFLKVANGSNMIRILPPKTEEESFMVEIPEHRFKWGSGIHYVTCFKAHNESCPLCDAYYKLWDMHNALGLPKGSKSKFGSRAGTIRGKPRYYMNVLNRKDNTVKIYSAPEQVFVLVMQGILGNDDLGIEPLGDVTDLQAGYDFNLISTPKGEFQSFEQSRFRATPSPLGNKSEIASILDQRHNLQALIKNEDYEKVKLLAESLLLDEPVTQSKEDSGAVEKPAPVTDEEFKNKINSKS